MVHDIDTPPLRKSIGQPLTYRDAARSHVHGLDDFAAWIAQAERGLVQGATATAQQADNIRYALEMLDALRPRLEALSSSVRQEVRR